MIRLPLCLTWLVAMQPPLLSIGGCSSTSFSGMYPLLTGQLTWQFIVFDGPSKLGWDLDVAIVDGLADQGIIPILYRLAESYRWGSFSILNWLAKNCKRGTYSIWYRQADLEESPLSTDQPDWYLTHLVWAGQTSKILTINIPASLISNLSYTG